MRIVLTSALTPPDHSGAGARALRMAQWFASAGLDTHLITYSGESKMDAFGVQIHTIRRSEVDRTRIPTALFLEVANIASSAVRLAAVLRGCKPDLVHAIEPSTTMGAAAALAARWARLPFTTGTTLAGSDDFISVRSKRGGRFRVYPFRIAERVVAISPLLKAELLKVPELAGRVELIPNPVDSHCFSPAKPAEKHVLRTRLGLNPDTFTLVAVGEICSRKQQHVIVDAVAQLAAGGCEAQLVLIGPYAEDNPYTLEIIASIRDQKMGDFVRMVGPQTNVHEWMQAADVFVAASQREGFGNVYIEAMSSALPVVYRPIQGITDFIFRGDTGVAACGVDETANAIRTLMSDKALRAEMGQRARREAIARFSVDRIGKQYLNVFEAACAEKNRARR